MEIKTKALKGLECCVEFLCDECPYAEYQHITYKLQCSHKMHQDLFKTLKSKKVIQIKSSEFPDSVYCPNCYKFLGFITNKHLKFCNECGQALKYKEEE